MMPCLKMQERVTVEIRGPDGEIKEKKFWVAEPISEKEMKHAPLVQMQERVAGKENFQLIEILNKGDVHDCR